MTSTKIRLTKMNLTEMTSAIKALAIMTSYKMNIAKKTLDKMT